ncbi:hypothetical protein NDU88_006358 [Pleurodeles waltl]|uniref:Uncharacterized protein n=1 Tax=Pleurodeles waltl TaxID=8319 RepID=A0AAV7RLD0_PLEWA|nr:hypothetical protein NDU88_006358 [Pleurodeles waltl]
MKDLIAWYKCVGVRERYRGEEVDRREKEGRRGRQGVPRRIQWIPELGGPGRTVSRLQAKGEQEEFSSPILGRRRQTPGSKTRVPAALQEKRGRRGCVGFSWAGLGRTGGERINGETKG